MFYGLWRYWQQARKELLILGSAFGLVFASITLLVMVALTGAFSQGNQNIFAVGVQNSAGSLSQVSPYVSQALDDVPGVRRQLLWTLNTNHVEILGEESQLRIAFTNSQYISMLNPRFLSGPQPYRCDPNCVLSGAAIASKFGQPDSISVGGQHYEVTAIFDQQSFEFPDGVKPDIILDASQLALASSMSQVFSMLSASFPDVSTQQLAEFVPIYRTLIEVVPSYDLTILEAQIAEAYEDQRHSFINIRRMFSLLGSDDQTLGVIQGPFFDQKAKDNMLLMRLLFLVAAVQLFLVSVVNVVSTLTRYNLMRTYENACRFALGGDKWGLFTNNVFFVQPVMLFAAVFGVGCLWGLQWTLSGIASDHLNISFPPMSHLTLAYVLMMFVVALFLPALINLRVFFNGVKTEKTTLNRRTILQLRGLNIVLFTLAIVSIFLATSTYSHWQALKQRGTENILTSANIIEVVHHGQGIVSPRWESVLRDVEQRAPSAGFLATLPGDRNLASKQFRFTDEQCEARFDGWENRFYGEPFSVVTGQTIQTENWGAQDIAVSRSVLSVCGFTASEALGKYIQDTDNNRYQIRAVVDDLLYDLHVPTPQFVIYSRELSLANLRTIVLPGQVDLAQIIAGLEQSFEEYNLQMSIREKGSLVRFITGKLTRETTTMVICFVLMGLSLSVLFLAFTQHVAKVFSMRNREWGTQRALGANKTRLRRLLITELSQEWSVALVLSILLTVLYAHMQQHLLTTSIFVTMTYVIVAASGALVGAAYFTDKQLRKRFRHTPADLLRSES